jgi:hypothetical protein
MIETINCIFIGKFNLMDSYFLKHLSGTILLSILFS